MLGRDKPTKQVKDSLQRAHRDYYIDNILNINITENPKKVHCYIKQKKSGESSIPVLKPDNVIISDSQKRLKLWTPNTRHSSPDDNYPEIDSDPVSTMPDILFAVPGIEKLLSNLNPLQAIWTWPPTHKNLRNCI